MRAVRCAAGIRGVMEGLSGPVGRLLLACAFLTSMVSTAPCQAPRPPSSLTFVARQAAAAYEAGRYEEALRLFAAYAASGGDGAEVRLDMGNCALKAGDLGRAVLEYRRALRFDPDLAGARHNLDVARKLMPARKSPWQPPPWEAFLDGIPAITLQGVVLGFALLANLAFCAALLAPPGRWRRFLAGAVAAMVTGGAVAGGLLFYAGEILPQRRPAVVVREAPAYGGPAAEGEPVDRLPPGSEVMLLKQAGDWRLVLWGDGRGWVSATCVEAP